MVAGVGPAAAGTDLTLELGTHHPSTHGSLRLRLVLDGDTVVAAEPLVGALHRGAEKLFEVRDYRQVLMLANRHDWLAAFKRGKAPLQRLQGVPGGEDVEEFLHC